MARFVSVILNPVASNGAGARVRLRVEAALRRLGVEFELSVTKCPRHATELAARAAAQGSGAILAVGGDGTVHEVANGLLACGVSPPPVAVVPVGTGNDFYRMVSLPQDVERATAVLTQGTPRNFDVGRVSWEGGARYFVNLLGIGIDAEVLRQRQRFLRLPGLAQYLAALLVALTRFRPVGLRVRLEDGELIESPAMLATVTVGPSLGGGFLIAPGAAPDDGQLDLCFIERLTRREIAQYLPKIVRGRHGGLPRVHLRRLRAATMESLTGQPIAFEMDGELTSGPTDRLEVELVPGCLPVLVPAQTT